MPPTPVISLRGSRAKGFLPPDSVTAPLTADGYGIAEMIAEHGSLAAYFWRWADPGDSPPHLEVPFTEVSTAISKDLKKRGWTFVGPTTNDYGAVCTLIAGPPAAEPKPTV